MKWNNYTVSYLFLTTPMKRTERWRPWHFIAASSCIFRRNTLVEEDWKYIIISTVGNYRPGWKLDTIWCERHYETMVFIWQKRWEYIDIDVSKQIYDMPLFWIEITLKNESYVDNEANDMHETNVEYVMNNFEECYVRWMEEN